MILKFDSYQTNQESQVTTYDSQLTTHGSRLTKILFCWSDISGYMSACWKSLSQHEGITLKIIAFSQSKETNFTKKLTEGLDIHFVDREPDKATINLITDQFNPDAIVLCGWFVPAYRQLALRKELSGTRFILAMDTPWWGTIRQQIGLRLLKRFMAKVDVVVSSGERSYQYAQRLQVKKINKMQYGVDVEHLSQFSAKRQKAPWPKTFLFMGRYAEAKGIRVLVAAFHQYQKQVDDPWELHTCGQGSLESLLAREDITNHGFVQPNDMDNIWLHAGCLVLPSTFDPWPLIVVEACAAGLPVIVTHASGSQVEVVKMYWNGLVINEGSVEELSKALLWIHNKYDLLPEMGRRSLEQARPYSAEAWAQKWVYLLRDL